MHKNILLMLDGMPAGGLERQVVELLKGTQEHQRYRFLLGVLMKGGEREREAEDYAWKVLPIKQSFRYDLTLAISLIKFIKAYDIDCIHTFGSISDISGLLAGKVRKIPVINGSVRSAPPYLYGRYLISRACMVGASFIVSNSYAGLKAFGVEEKANTAVIYNGFDWRRLKELPQNTVNNLELCMVGNFTRKKDQESLIKSLQVVRRKYANCRLTLVGRGTKKINQIKKQIRRLGCETAITIVDNSDNPEIYISRSSLCILLTNYRIHGEGISNAIMEYMALSKPVIATDYGGNRELVVDGETGILIPDHTPETLSKAIIDLLSDKSKMKKMGDAGYIRLKEKFSLDEMVSNYEKLYDGLLC